jgi:AcrR family transcriptional regulator
MQDAQSLPSRQILIEAGKVLSVREGSAMQLSIEQLCLATNLPEPLFYTYFSDLRAYRMALLQHYLDLARAEAIGGMMASASGLPRIFAAWTQYWDANLQWRPLRELAIHFRTDVEGFEILRMRLAGVVLICQYELKSIQWPNPAETARLTAHMVVETAVAEFEAGRALPAMRETVLAYFRAPPPHA